MKTVDITRYQAENVAKVESINQKRTQAQDSQYDELLDYVREKLKDNHADIFLGSIFDPKVQEEASDWINQYAREWLKDNGTINQKGVDETIKSICNDILDTGVLAPIIKIKGVTDIFADGHKDIYYEVNGTKKQSDEVFKSEAEMLMVMKKIAAAAGKNLNAENPVVNAQIGKNRFNLVLGKQEKGIGSTHQITIRVHRVEQFKPEELIESGQVTQEAVDFLNDMGKCKKIAGMFFGPTGSGKSTSMDALVLEAIPDDERTIVIEDEPELRCKEKRPNKKIVELLTKKSDNPKTAYSMARLVEEVALRAKPDRLVIGEIRLGEDGDKFLYALSTGHKGWSTGHADSAKEGVKRLAKMVLTTRPSASVEEIVNDIFGILDIIVFCDIIKVNGINQRRITEIYELYQNNDKNEFRCIFEYEPGKGLVRKGVISEKIASKLKNCEIDHERWLNL